MPLDFLAARRAFAGRDRSALLTCLLAAYDHPLVDLAAKVDALIAWPQVDLPPRAFDREFAQCLSEAGAALRAGQAPRFPGSHHLPASMDFIAGLSGYEAWSIEQLLTRLALDSMVPRRRAAVVGTMRDDGVYVLEWIAHYLALGFEHVFIYTNDNADGTDELLACLAAAGLVTVSNNVVTGAVPPETKAFGHALNLLPELRDFEWALFVDSDEFLVPAPEYGLSIEAILAALARRWPAGEAAAVCYDWLWFISDMTFRREPGLLCERFQHARPHWLAKCLVRVRDVLSMRQQHAPDVAPGFVFVDSAFNALDPATMDQRREAEYRGGRLNHYWPKS